MPGGPDPTPDDEDYRPPLPPADRVWRHPAEVAAERAAAGPGGVDPDGGHAGTRAAVAARHRHHLRTATLVAVVFVAVSGSIALVDHSLQLSGPASDPADRGPVARFTATSSPWPAPLRALGQAATEVTALDAGAVDTAMGVRITHCVRGGAAETGGLRAGDVVVRVGLVPVNRTRDLTAALASVSAGALVNVTVVRDGQAVQVHVPVSDRD